MELSKIKSALENGLLSFPVTDFDARDTFNAPTYASRLKWFMEHGVSSIFVAGGTGEFFSLNTEEYKEIVQCATSVVQGTVPVISSTGKSVREAIAYAKIAEEAGVDALLLFPPYLTECPQDGIARYARAIIQHTSLPVIYYNRGNGILHTGQIEQLAADCPNFIGLKDGTGNMQDLNETIKTLGNRLSYIGGVPTAEIIAEAYLSIGVNTYSSAAFNFVPKLAMRFYNALRAGDQATVTELTQRFFIPLIRLRARKQGYAVSLIKAGATIIGRSAGDVRPPLVMPEGDDLHTLELLIAQNS